MRIRMERNAASDVAAMKLLPVVVALMLVFFGNYRYAIMRPTENTFDHNLLDVRLANATRAKNSALEYPVARGSVLDFYFDNDWQAGTVTSIQDHTFATILSNGTIINSIAKADFKKTWRLPCMGNEPGAVSLARTSLTNGPKTSPVPKLSDQFLDRFIVIPEHKLLFCYVEKVGWTCDWRIHADRFL